MKDINILILSAGRRVELVQSFKKAAARLKIQSNVVAGDCSSIAPALYFADKRYKLPRIVEPNYVDSIIDICNKEEISLVVPTIDTDLMILASHKATIEKQTNARVLVSDSEVIEICRDKVNTQDFLEMHNFKMPRMYTVEELKRDDLEYPLFIKPRSGSSSIDVFKVYNRRELHFYRNMIDNPIVQDFVKGEEYSVDVFMDFDGRIITITPRLRIETRGGEISKGKIIKDRLIIDDVTRLMEVLRPIGHITVQLMKTEMGIQYIEINPRFGGGAPMSIQSGADSCENLYRLLMGEKLEYNEDYRDNITFLRFDNSICLDENMEPVE